jgi:hypothetical protein
LGFQIELCWPFGLNILTFFGLKKLFGLLFEKLGKSFETENSIELDLTVSASFKPKLYMKLPHSDNCSNKVVMRTENNGICVKTSKINERMNV